MDEMGRDFVESVESRLQTMLGRFLSIGEEPLYRRFHSNWISPRRADVWPQQNGGILLVSNEISPFAPQISKSRRDLSNIAILNGAEFPEAVAKVDLD